MATLALSILSGPSMTLESAIPALARASLRARPPSLPRFKTAASFAVRRVRQSANLGAVVVDSWSITAFAVLAAFNSSSTLTIHVRRRCQLLHLADIRQTQ